MAEITVRVCDACERPNADHYEIRRGDREWTVDLCLKCAEPLSKKKAKKLRSARRFEITPLPDDE